MEDNSLVAINFEDYAMSCDSVVRQVNVIQNVMKSVMKEEEHFGTIPGTNKPSLYKPGAEKLSLVFRLRPEYQITKTDLPGGHREYEIICSLFHIPTGLMIGQGVGAATTMEAKYRFRGGEKEGTGKAVPKEYWNLKKEGKTAEAQALIGGRGFSPGKVDGNWEICSIGEKVEHDNPADYYNTVLKMAKKRAHVDAILTATAASDIFTQDTEDMADNGAIKQEKKESKQEQKRAESKKETKFENSEAKQPEGEKVAVGIESILQNKGKKKDGSEYTKYTVADEKGNTYTTFDKKFAEIAKEAREKGVYAIITFKKSQYGKDITAMELDITNHDSTEVQA